MAYIFESRITDKSRQPIYSGASGRSDDLSYNLTSVLSSQVHSILSKYSHSGSNGSEFLTLRKMSTIDQSCSSRIRANETELNKPLECYQTGTNYYYFYYDITLFIKILIPFSFLNN